MNIFEAFIKESLLLFSYCSLWISHIDSLNSDQYSAVYSTPNCESGSPGFERLWRCYCGIQVYVLIGGGDTVVYRWMCWLVAVTLWYTGECVDWWRCYCGIQVNVLIGGGVTVVYRCTLKPVLTVTCIKQQPLLSSH